MKSKSYSFLLLTLLLFAANTQPFSLCAQPHSPLAQMMAGAANLSHQDMYPGQPDATKSATGVPIVTSDVCTWVGGTANWDASAANWGCGHLPAPTDIVVINSGNPILTTNTTVDALSINGGTLSGNFNLTVTNNFDHNAGTLSGGGVCTVNGAYITNLSNTSVVSINLYKELVLNGGGTVNNSNIYNLGKPLTIASNQTLTFNATLGSGFGVYEQVGALDASPLIIQPNAVVRKIGPMEVRLDAFSFNNQGTLRNEGAPGGLLMGAVSGTANTHVNGNIYIADGSEIVITGGTHDLSNCNISGGGLLTSGVNNAVLNMSGTTVLTTNMRINAWYNTTWNLNGFAATVRSFRIVGNVTGSADITATDYIHMDGAPNYAANGNLTCLGNMSILYGTCTVGGSGNLVISGNLDLIRQTGVSEATILNLNRDAAISGNITSNHATCVLNLQTGKTLDLNSTANRSATGAGSINVNGTLLKSGLNTLFTIASPLNITASGQVVGTTGRLTLSGTATNGGAIKGTGFLELAGTFTNNGLFAPGFSPGLLRVIGIYDNATLEFEIGESGGAVNKDLLFVTGDMVLDGTLNIGYLGGNVPAGTYDIAVCTGTRTGEFTTINYPAICNGNCLVIYTSTRARLQVAAPLPLELLSFTANALPQTNEIRWATGSERNVAHHLLERSPDGLGHWQEIDRQAGALQSSSERQYRYVDQRPLPIAYYRLRSINLDGSEQVSPVIPVARPGKQLTIHAAYPVPVQNELNVVLTVTEEGEIVLEVLDILGRVVVRQAMEAVAGANNVQVSLRGVSVGTYQLMLRNEREQAEVWTVVKE